MPLDKGKLYRWRTKVQIASIVLGTSLVLLSVWILRVQRKWLIPQFRSGEDAFIHGPIGTELVPLPVMQVLPSMFPEHFQPLGPRAGDWIEQFGFIRAADNPALAQSFTKEGTLGLPVGFTVSR